MYVKVRVRTGAKKESVEQLTGDRFAISVKELAERNQANERVVELIAAHFKISPAKIRIKSGHHSPSKILSVL